MSAPLVLDLETVPLAASLAAPYPKEERSYPSNYKDPEKIAAWYERDEAAWKAERVKECSLNPRLGRILCIGVASADVATQCLQADAEADERHTLQTFWAAANESRGRIVTFNGRTFDLRWIVLRSLAHGITPTLPSDVVRSWFKRYVVAPHCDVRDLLTNWDGRESGTLAEWCALVGVPYENGHSGGDIYQLYVDGKFDEIAAKNRADVVATRALYQRVAKMFCSEAA